MRTKSCYVSYRACTLAHQARCVRGVSSSWLQTTSSSSSTCFAVTLSTSTSQSFQTTHTHSISLSSLSLSLSLSLTLSLSLSHTHTHTHSLSLTHTHTHTHTLSLSLSLSLSLTHSHSLTPLLKTIQVRERLALTFGKLLLRAPRPVDAGTDDLRVTTKVDLVIAKKQALFVDHFLRNADSVTDD